MDTSWHFLLRSDEVTPDSLREAFRLALTQHQALAGVSPVQNDPLQLQAKTKTGKTFTVQLHNLYADAQRAAPGERPALLQRFMAATLEAALSLNGELPTPSLNQVVPTIKDVTWIEQAPGGNDIAAEHLVANLYVVYAFDRPNSLAYARWEELNPLVPSREELREISLVNLRRRLPPELGTKGDGKSLILLAGGNFESSLILLDEVWEQFELTMPGEIIACVLARDICLVTATGIPGGLDSLRVARERICRGDRPSNFISKSLFRRSAGCWTPLHETS
jgi:uncharacterized protein YtpQ (UPF0354 family)